MAFEMSTIPLNVPKFHDQKYQLMAVLQQIVIKFLALLGV